MPVGLNKVTPFRNGTPLKWSLRGKAYPIRKYDKYFWWIS